MGEKERGEGMFLPGFLWKKHTATAAYPAWLQSQKEQLSQVEPIHRDLCTTLCTGST